MNFVTGGTGLLGAHLILDLIKKGEPVRALKRPSSSLQDVLDVFLYYEPNEGRQLFELVEWVDGDVLNVPSLESAMEGANHVYHSAALVSFQKKDRYRMLRINRIGTANMVNVALEYEVNKFCHVSSTAAIGRSDNPGLIAESNKWKNNRNNTNYAISKYAAEQEVWRAAEEGLNMVIVNPSVIIGPGNWNRSSGAMFKTVWEGLKFFTDGANGYVDARDVSNVMRTLMESKIHTDRFLVIGENHSFQEVFSMIAKALNKPQPFKKASPAMTKTAAFLLGVRGKITGQASPITRETARTGHKQFHYSNEKIKKALDFKFTPIEEAVQNAAEYFLKHQTK